MKLSLLLSCRALPFLHSAEVIETDLLFVGGDESGCAAAVQAARLGLKRIVLVNDIDRLGGQFCTQGIGPIDEWTIVNGKPAEFPASGAFAEILTRIHQHNFKTYGIATPGKPKFFGTRNWNSHSDRAMFPLRGLVPVKMDGLLGCSKNIGVTSMVQSSLRLHGQMMHAGTAVGTVSTMALKAGIQPRDIASSPPRVREVQRTLLRQGTLFWPWHDVRSDEPHFEAGKSAHHRGHLAR